MTESAAGGESLETKYIGLINEGYSVIDEIGKGSYSTVLRVKKRNQKTELSGDSGTGGQQERENGTDLAAKAINKLKLKPQYLAKFIPRELDIMARIRHPNIIRIDRIVKSKGYIYLIGELAANGDLLSYIRHKKKMNEREARQVFGDCLSGIEYLHRKGIVHRDIKCENVLFTADMKAKLCDLGFARYQPRDADNGEDLSKTFCGSAAYAPPEILESKPYKGRPADIWSLGVLLYIMVTGLMPYDERKPEKMLDRQKRHQIPYHRSVVISTEVRELIKQMLHPQWYLRASIGWIKISPWMCSTAPIPPDFLHQFSSQPAPAAPSVPETIAVETATS